MTKEIEIIPKHILIKDFGQTIREFLAARWEANPLSYGLVGHKYFAALDDRPYDRIWAFVALADQRDQVEVVFFSGKRMICSLDTKIQVRPE